MDTARWKFRIQTSHAAVVSRLADNPGFMAIPMCYNSHVLPTSALELRNAAPCCRDLLYITQEVLKPPLLYLCTPPRR